MAQLRLLVLLTNLVLLRLALADPTTTSTQQDSSHSLFDHINSLDFQPNELTGSLASAGLPTEPETSSAKPRRAGKSIDLSSNNSTSSGASGKKQQKAAQNQQQLPQMLMSLLSQLEKLDVKRLIAEGFRQQHGQRSRSSYDLVANQTGAKAKQVGPVSGEAGNLLSIGKQLVKLARSQIGSDLSPAASWLSHSLWPSASPSPSSWSLAGDEYAPAGFKSDWFWVVVPAVIVIGAGVIVVPLIAAWLVSLTMSQNSFTVSAGRRRRRRDLSNMEPQLVADQTHSDLFKMLDFHRLFDEPQLLVNKLTKLHSAIDSVGSSLIQSTLDEYKGEPGKRRKV